MGLTHLRWASFGPDNLSDGDIYGLGGCEDLSTRIWFSSYALPSNFSMIFRRVSIYFVEDCLRKCKMHIFGKKGGHDKKILLLLLRKSYFLRLWQNKLYKFDM